MGKPVALARKLPLVATRDIGTAAARLLLDRGWMPADPGVALCRSANDRLAAAVAASPADAIAELDRAVCGLGMRGVLILGRPGDRFLDDPVYRSVLARIAELRVPLYVHPFIPVPQVQQAYYAGFDDKVTAELSLGGRGWHHEAGIQVLRMILGKVFDHLPDLYCGDDARQTPGRRPLRVVRAHTGCRPPSHRRPGAVLHRLTLPPPRRGSSRALLRGAVPSPRTVPRSPPEYAFPCGLKAFSCRSPVGP
ncbi:amidohydrolase family protein [Streptomyces tendae]|uniref:amidohydrolase family protein n=1 Tax=Streptomyces tendae TaxID=1932 RepID=UPI0033A29415